MWMTMVIVRVQRVFIHIFHITGFGCELGGAIIPSIKCTGSKSISVTRASSTGSFFLNVLAPNAPIRVPFCLNLGKFSNKLLTPPGEKKQITS